MPPRALLTLPSHPPILPLPIRRAGNNVPHSLHKTRRTWRANVKRYDLPVTVLGDAVAAAQTAATESAASLASSKAGPSRIRFPHLSGVKMTTRDLKSVSKAGGIEGLLLSRPATHLTPYGRALRHQLFAQLHDIRAALEAEETGPLIEKGETLEALQSASEVPLLEGR